MRLRCAILDDYQTVALKLADWSRITDRVELTVFDQPFASADETIAALQNFAIVCAMRERTPFRRDTLMQLPNLKLLMTSGMRNASFDLQAAQECGVTVCGTGTVGNPTAALTIGLMLELMRRIGFENERMKHGERWQTTIGHDVEGKTLGIVGLGKLGRKVAQVAAALDVFAQEPLPRDHPLRSLDNVVLTPHLGYVTEDNYRRYYSDMVENITAWLDGKPIRVLD